MDIEGTEIAEVDVYRSLLTIGEAKGYRRGWAANQYRELSGRWPEFGRWMQPAPEAAQAVVQWVKDRARAHVEAQIARKMAQKQAIRAKLVAGFGREP